MVRAFNLAANTTLIPSPGMWVRWFLLDASWNECWLFDVCPILLNPQRKLGRSVDKINKVFPESGKTRQQAKTSSKL